MMLKGRAYPARLTVAGYIWLEERFDEGVYGFGQRIIAGDFYLYEIWNFAYVALVGGGMTHKETTGLLLSDWSFSGALEVSMSAIEIIAASIGESKKPERAKNNNLSEPADFASIYQNAFAIGLKPADLNDMTFWEFNQCVEGWNLANGGVEALAAPDQGELAELMKRYG